MEHDEFDFSDADLDDLPANTLQHLEASARRATQHPPPPAPESDYGLDDGDEVVNLDDDAGAAHTYAAPAPQHILRPPPALAHAHHHDAPHASDGDDMDVEAPPRPSQVEAGPLLARIKKVGRRRAPWESAADVRSSSRTRCARRRKPTR